MSTGLLDDQMNNASIEDIDELDLIPDDELEETYLERIAALSEMFPRSVRNGSSLIVKTTVSTSSWVYGTAKSAAWITLTSLIILALPVAVEVSQMQAAAGEKRERSEKLFSQE